MEAQPKVAQKRCWWWHLEIHVHHVQGFNYLEMAQAHIWKHGPTVDKAEGSHELVQPVEPCKFAYKTRNRTAAYMARTKLPAMHSYTSHSSQLKHGTYAYLREWELIMRILPPARTSVLATIAKPLTTTTGENIDTCTKDRVATTTVRGWKMLRTNDDKDSRELMVPACLLRVQVFQKAIVLQRLYTAS